MKVNFLWLCVSGFPQEIFLWENFLLDDVCTSSTWNKSSSFWSTDYPLPLLKSVSLKYKIFSVSLLCPTLCDLVDCNPPGFSSMGFSRQEYWSEWPFPSPGDLPDPGIKPISPVLQAVFNIWATRKSHPAKGPCLKLHNKIMEGV